MKSFKSIMKTFKNVSFQFFCDVVSYYVVTTLMLMSAFMQAGLEGARADQEEVFRQGVKDSDFRKIEIQNIQLTARQQRGVR
jgi:hypothetical protein